MRGHSHTSSRLPQSLACRMALKLAQVPQHQSERKDTLLTVSIMEQFGNLRSAMWKEISQENEEGCSPTGTPNYRRRKGTGQRQEDDWSVKSQYVPMLLEMMSFLLTFSNSPVSLVMFGNLFQKTES